MNPTDRYVRGIAGVALVFISPVGIDLLHGSVVAWFCFAFGLANVISAPLGWCFMYSLVGLSSVEQTQDESDSTATYAKFDYKRIRLKTVLGFGAIALALVLLYMFESIQVSKSSALFSELKALHKLTLMVAEDLESKLDSVSPTQHQITSQTLDDALYHLNDPAVLYITTPDGSVSTVKGIEAQKGERLVADALELSLQGQRDHLPYDIMAHQKAIQANDMPGFERLNIEGDDYLLMSHGIFHERFGHFTMTLGLISTSEKDTLISVLPRLVLSSFIVFWLAIWGAIGVSYFIWRYIESANNRVYKLAVTDPETGLANEIGLRELMDDLRIFSRDRDLRVVGVLLRNYSVISSNTDSHTLNKLMRELGNKLKNRIRGEHYLARLNNGTIIFIAEESNVKAFDEFRDIIGEVHWVEDFQFAFEPTEVQMCFPDDITNFEELRTTTSNLVVTALRLALPILRFDSSLIQTSNKRKDYASEIRRALAHHEFELYLQPKFDLRLGGICGAEALVRWNHPQDGLLTPGHFIDLIDRSNARSDFATFVINESAMLATQLQQSGYEIPISLNLSANDLFDHDVQATLATVAKKLELKNNPVLEIELTEAQTSIDLPQIASALKMLSWLGYTIALDDFGTGMSSFSYSNELPINTIKIDKSFIDKIGVKKHAEVAISAIMLLAKGYGYSVIAEGVENSDQVDAMKSLGCWTIQGYYFSKPVTYSDFLRLANNKAISPY